MGSRWLYCALGILFLTGHGGLRRLAADEIGPKDRPRLVVLLVFDQLRGDYLERWGPLFGQGGFQRLCQEGVWYKNCHYDYASTLTAAGHASMVTGCAPARHGIIANDWYDRVQGKRTASIHNPRFVLVPDLFKEGQAGHKEERSGAWPGNRLQPTVGDVLRQATRGQGKVISLSIKDRSAILLAGLLAQAVYWFSTAMGGFVSSTYYVESPHRWVAEFNQSRPADKWFGQDWDRLRADIDYARFSSPDDAPGEGKGIQQGKTFPHPTTGGQDKITPAFYDAVTNSPFGNELLLSLAKRAIVAEKLGADQVPDLLCLSFSSNDLIGHVWGPDSQEVLDMTLRTDRLVQDLLGFLDQQVGRGRYAVVVTADHGICPLPEISLAQGKKAGRVSTRVLQLQANAFLDEQLAAGQQHEWIEAVVAPSVYLNRRLLAERKLYAADVERVLAQWLGKQPGIQTAYTRQQLGADLPKEDRVGRMVRRSFHPERSGDVIIVTQPYWLLTSYPTGTTHGAPHLYDTHVPLLVFGPDVRPSKPEAAVTPLAVAPILAHLLGIPPPAGNEKTLPPGLVP